MSALPPKSDSGLERKHCYHVPKAGSELWSGRVDRSGPRRLRTFRALQQGRHRHGQYLICRLAELRGRSAASLALAEAS
jgi:hypothetical protein